MIAGLIAMAKYFVAFLLVRLEKSNSKLHAFDPGARCERLLMLGTKHLWAFYYLTCFYFETNTHHFRDI